MSAFPDMTDALDEWAVNLKAEVLRRSVDGFEAKAEVIATEPFTGVLLPIPATKLWVKPEGQRSWQWWSLQTARVLSLGDTVIDPDGRRLKIMAVQDWGSYRSYDLTEATNKP